jgi:hypothetical protein
MKSRFWVTIGAVLALAACNQPSAPPKADNFLFPALGATPYAAEYTMNGGDMERTMRILRSGANQRMESALPNGQTGIMLIEGASGKMYSFQMGDGAPKAAVLIDRSKLGALAGTMDFEEEAKTTPPKHMGSDTVAGIGCDIWRMDPAEGETADAREVCATRDGILLRVQEPGAQKPELVATKVDRGPQDPSLFAVPAGYQVVDMSECTNAMANMMEAAKAGKRPDMALMNKCQEMGKLMGAQ